ncbi:unnamed protein product [Periconia digitata]|uniref:Methyltransferase type 11 domain-containing protein n=1 Tax=Periconia digitata TaxID=1303443 RepID=A0A9W4XWJ1_9PLEO|nr:unnamed protein product [Periconia digitata]
MASYKSRVNPPRREDQTPYTQVPTTRLPQRSVTPTLQSGHSKLQKRNPNRDEQPRSSSRAPSTVRSRQDRTIPTPQPSSRPSLSKTPLQHSSSRLPKLEVPRAVITPTPSLVSGSSVSTSDSPRSSVLRKKQSSLAARPRRDDSLPSYEGRQMIKEPFSSFKDPFSETVLGISIPQTSNTPVPLQVDTEYAYSYEPGPTDMAPPSFPQYAPSTTPSTGYSASPSLFSVSSTPNSLSSYSPGVTLPSKPATRMRQASPLSGKPPGAKFATPEPSSSRGPTPSTSGMQVERQKAKQGTERLPAVRRPSGSATEKPRVQAPPELAHLADSPATSRRPSRPSREGTSEIVGLRGPSPVIQSNMSSFPSAHRRTPSTESASVPNSRARFGLPSKSSSRNPSPNPSLASASHAPIRGTTPDVEKERSQTLPTKSSRFGFFTRRTKTEPSTAKPEKKHRRGPAAGTGHEGYGRYAFRGRSGSTGSVTPSIGHSASAATTSESLTRTPSTRKSSVTSTSSTDMDDFLLNRLAPRVIRGNGSSDGLTRSPEPMESTSSLNVSSPPVEHQKKAEVEAKRPSLLPSAMSGPVRSLSPTKKPVIGSRRPSESDDDTKRSFIPSLTSKRTSRMSKVIEPKPTPRAPRSGSALGKGRKGSVDDYASDGKEGNWLKASKKEKEVSKPRKWNFFQRAHAGPRAATPAVEVATAVPASRSVAHYALASEAGIDLEDIEQLMEEDSSPESESIPVETHEETPEVKERLHSMLLPPKPVLPAEFAMQARPASPKVSLRGESDSDTQRLDVGVNNSIAHEISESHDLGDLTPVTDLSPCSSPSRPSSPVESVVSPKTTTLGPLPVFAPKMASPPELPQIYSPPLGPPPSSPPPKPSRLAQVGRIPQVVSRRNQPHRPAQSFSRPFAANQPHPSLPTRTSIDATSYYAEPYPVLQGLNALSHASAIATLSPTAEESHRQSEFFKFPQRKDSEVSYSSSSGTWSFLPTAGTAIVPPTGAPQSEDEVWNEYDDLIDEVLSPSEADAKLKPRSSLEPLPLNIKTDATHPSYHLRRSRLLSVLHAQSPTSPVSLSEFLQGYGEKTISVVDPVTGRLSFPSARMSSGSAPRNNRASSTRSSLPASLTLSARPSKATLASSSEKDRDTKLKELTEADGTGLVSMANLRFGALMTSKWLSFGRVLFSPAHFELKNPEDRVLVIDGLGKDWSYYCALTYPEATVYNLGPGASVSPQSGSGNATAANEPWSTLANHRHISHPSPKTAFPFPKGFFACVVLRFPSALPSSTHRFVISECKRVLRPGGHLELSVLDLDLVNMGNRARRAVRGLKVKMQVADENTSLRNMSDEIMGVLGRKGFVECNRCFVGVPVAGGLPCPSDDASTKSTSRKGSVASSSASGAAAAAGKKQSSTRTATPKQELSFTELLNLTSSPTPSSSASTSTSIADMVARVGRWWYSRCYESVVLPEAGSSSATENSGQMLETSLWNDEALVRECEKRGTSFRLLIGFATKPECGVRRTVSV